MRPPKIVTKILHGALCISFLVGIASADPEAKSFYVANDGKQSSIQTEQRTNDFLKENVPDGIKDGQISWKHWDPPSKPYAHQNSIELDGGLILTSTLYMKNCIRIISVSDKETPDKHRIIFYQDSFWSGSHIKQDKVTGGVKMAIDSDEKFFVVITSIEGSLKITLPNAQSVPRE